MANLLQSAGGAGNKRFHTFYLQPSSALLGYPLSFFQRRGSSLLTLSLSDLKLTYFVWHAKTRCLVGPTAAKNRWLEILHPLSVEYRRHLHTPTPFGTSLTHLAERHQQQTLAQTLASRPASHGASWHARLARLPRPLIRFHCLV